MQVVTYGPNGPYGGRLAGRQLCCHLAIADASRGLWTQWTQWTLWTFRSLMQVVAYGPNGPYGPFDR